MIKFKKSEIDKLAERLTSNSELFGDEIASVKAQLVALSNSANEFGCAMEDKISNYWGSAISVIALPDKAKHNWSF